MSELNIPLRQFARTAAQLATENPILLDKQLVIERDTGKMKLGNGTTAFNSLPYLLFSGTSSQFVRGDGSLATFPSIPSIAGLVPYTGATANVNLGTNTITANQLIKSGGTASQFLKADGSIDSTVYYPNSNPSGFITSAALSGYISGSLTTGYLPVATGAGTVANSVLQEVSGNLGLGVTPSAWSGVKTLQIGNSSFLDSPTSLQLTYNAYYDGSNWRYIKSDAASNYYQASGRHAWRTAPSGTAGNFFTTFPDVMTLAATGNLLIGTTADNGVDRLQVNGSARITGVVTASQISTTKQTLTPTGTTQTIDWNNGSIVDLVLSSATGNVTLTLLNAQNAICPLIEVTNGATPRNLIFPTGTIQANGGGNVYVGTANQKDLIAVLWDGSQFLISVSRNYA